MPSSPPAIHSVRSIRWLYPCRSLRSGFCRRWEYRSDVGVAGAVKAEVAVDVGERSLKVAYIFRKAPILIVCVPQTFVKSSSNCRHFLTDGVLAGRFENVLLREVRERLVAGSCYTTESSSEAAVNRAVRIAQAWSCRSLRCRRTDGEIAVSPVAMSSLVVVELKMWTK